MVNPCPSQQAEKGWWAKSRRGQLQLGWASGWGLRTGAAWRWEAQGLSQGCPGTALGSSVVSGLGFPRVLELACCLPAHQGSPKAPCH